MRQKIIVAMPTFEPNYVFDADLEDYYQKNFDSFLDPVGPYDAILGLTDFRSSDAYRSFLRRYAEQRPGRVILFLGHKRTGSLQAVNIVYRNYTEGDFVVYAQSDTRARDRHWLELLAADFQEDPEVVAVFSSNPIDACSKSDQVQPEPLDRPSRTVSYPTMPVPNVAAFHRKMLVPFGNRLADIFVNKGTEEGILWQIMATGRITMSYRCNMLHLPFRESGRYDRTTDKHWSMSAVDAEGRMQVLLSDLLPVPQPLLRSRGPAELTPWEMVLEGLRGGTLRSVARALYINWRRSQVIYIWRQIKLRGLLGYLGQKRLARRRLEMFNNLPLFSRLRLIEALYFADPVTYQKNDWEVFPSPSVPDNS